ncbi:MAG: hypothetical protein JJ900_12325 [Rhodospirillales bacterium]|nr:hypothetical protein [Rhodospirillales bacterium]MBO6787630.1 hypothetical protein [Rhodospirillales bacterium]
MLIAEIEPDDLEGGLADVYRYWLDLKGTADIGPAWRDFDMLELPPGLLPSMLVIDVADPMTDSVYRYWGRELSYIHGVDMTGKCPYDLTPVELGQQLLTDHTKVVQSRRPSFGHYIFETFDKYKLTHSMIRLPLSNDGMFVDNIVVITDFSENALRMIDKFRVDYREGSRRQATS